MKPFIVQIGEARFLVKFNRWRNGNLRDLLRPRKLSQDPQYELREPGPSERSGRFHAIHVCRIYSDALHPELGQWDLVAQGETEASLRDKFNDIKGMKESLKKALVGWGLHGRQTFWECFLNEVRAERGKVA